MTKYTITEEQLLIYVHGESQARKILDQDLQDHYRIALQKLNQGKIFVWNPAAFFLSILWFLEKRLYHVCVILYVILTLITLPVIKGIITNDSLFLAKDPLLALVLYYGLALLPIAIFSGLFADKILISSLSKQIQKGNFDDLPEETKTNFITKFGITELQYLSFIYGAEKAEILIKHNIPDHYRQAFKKFAQGKRFVWNWPAGLFAYYWLLYRRIPHWAIFLFSLTFVLTVFLSLFPPQIMYLFFYINPFSGLFGDRLLLGYIRNQTVKNNFEGLPKGGASGFFMTSFLIVIIYVELQKNNLIDRFSIPMVTLSLLITFFLIPIIAIIYTKYKVWNYKRNNQD